MKIYSGASLNDWALPLHIFAGKPFTEPVEFDQEDGRWVIQVVITILCFYVAIEI